MNQSQWRGLVPGRLATLVICLALVASGALAELAPEQGRVATLPAQPSPHWVWVTDVVFNHMEAGKNYLIDGDTGRFLGMVSVGFSATGLIIPKAHNEIYAPETYLARGTRGARTDLIQVYDAVTLQALEEVIIPPKRAETSPSLHNQVLTDDDKFALIYNFTPAQSVSVVDVAARKFVGEIETPGCAFVFPTGNKRFQMLCADGSLLSVHLTDTGSVHGKARSQPLFDPEGDYLFERGVRTGKYWLFPSIESNIYAIDVSSPKPKLVTPWSLLTDQQRTDRWRVGGMQNITVHTLTNRLYALMHQGDENSRKDPGGEIWVYDLRSKERIDRIELKTIASSILVSGDNEPLLFTVFGGQPGLEIYDALSGEHRHTVTELGFTPALLQTAVGR